MVSPRPYRRLWSPEMAPPVSGYVRWWDMSDTASITQSANAVSQVNDGSVTADNLTQATGANQPLTNTDTLNGLNVIKYDGTNDNLTGGAGNTIAQPDTIFIAFKSSGFSGDAHML